MTNLLVSRNFVAVAAAVLILVQNALFLSSLSIIENLNQNVWLVVNSIEVIVLLIAAKLLMTTHQKIAVLLLIIATYLASAIILENFIYQVSGGVGDGFWIFNSTLLSGGLILCVAYLFKK